MTKKPCQNNPQFMYTGKESSPRGLGWCAENMTVGERMKGRDGTMWMVSIKNSLHVWTRVPTDVEAPETGAAALAPATAADAAPEPSFAATPAKKKPAPKKKAAAPAAPEPELIPDDLPPLEDTGAVLDDAEPEAAPAEAAPEPEPEAPPVPAPKKKAPAKKKAAAVAEPEPEAPDAEAPEPTPEPAPKKKAAARAPKAAAAAAESPPKAPTPKAKRPPTDFALFIKMKVREIKAADPAGRANEALSTAAKAWSALSPDEKAQEIARARAAYEAGELA